jgi:hypothetical protein
MRVGPSSCVFGVRLAHEPLEVAVDVGQGAQPKVNSVAQAAERLDPVQARVFDSAGEPETRVEPVVVDDRAGKSHPRLEYDPSFLGIDGDGATRAGQSAPLIEQLPH